MATADATSETTGAAEGTSLNFIEQKVKADAERGVGIVTRFPPEPNGYLHVGHAKSILLNFGLASKYKGRCHLRFDDTNPTKEETEYVDSIMADVRWLGGDWGEHLHYASDYFDQLYEWAEHLIQEGLAYVDDQTLQEIRAGRGDHGPGTNSPFRDRSVEENLDLFRRMKAGEFEDGKRVLRAKIDMAHPNPNMRDPLLYRILHAEHHRTGNKWCIYPMYDYAHGQSDAIEHITHSICTLEFELHRPLYEWFLEKLPVPAQPRQTEFARLSLTYTVTSKRKLRQLVFEGRVSGWDDPRMPTLSGMRRRGYTPESLRTFCDTIGVTKNNSMIDLEVLEQHLNSDLDARCERRMAVLEPLKVVIENLPEGEEVVCTARNHPTKEEMGEREVKLSRCIWIERGDFMEDPPKKFFRLAPGKEVRLRYACYITCTDVIKADTGEVVELRATWDPESRGGTTPDGRKVKGTIHWVNQADAVPLEARLYERLFTCERADDLSQENFLEHLNPASQKNVEAYVEPCVKGTAPGVAFQFERKGFFVVDPDTTEDKVVANRCVPLKDSFEKK